MSVHSILILPPNVRFNDVREVLIRLYGACAKQTGLEPRFEPDRHSPACGEMFVRTVKRYECQSDPYQDRFMWSFEAEGWNGERMIED
jgi:hypothetical protein